jgi:crossover junction endodeoxyribonuclease RuvC
LLRSKSNKEKSYLKSNMKKKIIETSPAPGAPDFILGLDISLNHTGYCIYDVCQQTYVKDVLDVNKKVGMERIDCIVTAVLNLARYGNELDQPQNKTPRNTFVFMEGYSFGSKGQSVISLGEVGGCVRLALYKESYKYIEVAPGVLKKFVTGKGNAQKNVMLMEILDEWGEKIYDDNVGDAFGLAKVGQAYFGVYPDKLKAFQNEALTTLKKDLK